MAQVLKFVRPGVNLWAAAFLGAGCVHLCLPATTLAQEKTAAFAVSAPSSRFLPEAPAGCPDAEVGPSAGLPPETGGPDL